MEETGRERVRGAEVPEGPVELGVSTPQWTVQEAEAGVVGLGFEEGLSCTSKLIRYFKPWFRGRPPGHRRGPGTAPGSSNLRG